MAPLATMVVRSDVLNSTRGISNPAIASFHDTSAAT
jgi:hypothetical protein